MYIQSRRFKLRLNQINKFLKLPPKSNVAAYHLQRRLAVCPLQPHYNRKSKSAHGSVQNRLCDHIAPNNTCFASTCYPNFYYIGKLTSKNINQNSLNT